MTGIALKKSRCMSSLETPIRNGNISISVETQLLRDDLKGFACAGAAQCLATEIFRSICHCIRNDRGIGKRHYRLFILPTCSERYSSLLCERKVILRDGLVVGKGANGERKELAPLAGLAHVINDFWNKSFVLLLCILFVQNAVLVVLERHTAEDIFTSQTAVPGIENISPVVRHEAEENMVTSCAHFHACIRLLRGETPRVTIATVLCLMEPPAVPTILKIAHIETVVRTAGMEDAITRHFLVHLTDHETMRKLQTMCAEEGFCLHDPATPMQSHLPQSLHVLLLRELFIKEDILLPGKVHGTETIAAIAAAEKEERFLTIGAILRVAQVITFRTIDAFIAEFAVIHEAAIHATLAVIDEIPEIAVFIMVRGSNEITIFVPARRVYVFAILAVIHGCGRQRNNA